MTLAYTDKGLLGSLKEHGFAELWSEGKSKFHKINPAIDSLQHSVSNHKNQILHEYFNTEPIHKVFV